MKSQFKIVHQKIQESFISNLLFYLAIVEFFFFSGEVYWTSILLGGVGKMRFLYVITCGLYFLLKVRHGVIRDIGSGKLVFIVFWVFVCTFLWGNGQHEPVWLNYLFFSFGSFLLYTVTEFGRLRTSLLKVLTWLTVVSIIVQVGHDFLSIFPAGRYVDAGGEIRYLSLRLFTTEWGENRLASIYWEPGQYQIVIYYVLLLFADEWSDLKQWRRSIKKFGVFVVAIVMTLSTTAYLIFILLIITAIVRSSSKNLKFLPIYMLIGLAAVSYLYNSEAVQKKVEQRENDHQRSSYTIRMADNIGCLMVALEDPLTGYGPGSKDMEHRLLSVGSETSSNGWLYGAAQLGFTYIIFLWICMWINLRKMHPQVNTLLLFAILILSQSNESVIYFPYIYLYAFNISRPPKLCICKKLQ